MNSEEICVRIIMILIILSSLAAPFSNDLASSQELFVVNLLKTDFTTKPGDYFILEFIMNKLDDAISKIYVQIEQSENFTADIGIFYPSCKGFLTINTNNNISERSCTIKTIFTAKDNNEKILKKVSYDITVNIQHPYYFEMTGENTVFSECTPITIDPKNVAEISIKNYSEIKITNAKLKITHDNDFVNFSYLEINPTANIEFIIKQGSIDLNVLKLPASNDYIFKVYLTWTKSKLFKSKVTLDIISLSTSESEIESDKLPKQKTINLFYRKLPDPISFELLKPAKIASPWPPSLYDANGRQVKIKPLYKTKEDKISIEGVISNKISEGGWLFICNEMIGFSDSGSSFNHQCFLPNEGRNNILITSYNYYGISESILFTVIKDTTPPKISLSGKNMQYIPGDDSYLAEADGYKTEITIYTEQNANLTIGGQRYKILEDKSIEDAFHPKKWFAKMKLDTRNKTNKFEIVCKDEVGNVTKSVLKITR
jgi:hypothetical protein